MSLLERHFAFTKGWWRSSDEAWLEQRKREWETVKNAGVLVLSGGTAKMFQQLGQFYLYGEETSPDDAANGRSTLSIDGINRYMLTPFETAAQARELFVGMGRARGQIDVWLGYMSSASVAFEDSPNLIVKLRAFATGVLTDRFQEVVSPDSSYLGKVDSPLVNVTAERGAWARTYLTEAGMSLSSDMPRNPHRGTARTFSYAGECLPYLMSLLRFMEEREENVCRVVESHWVKELFRALTTRGRDAGFKPWQMELANKLRAAFVDSNAPQCLRKGMGSDGVAEDPCEGHY